MKNEIFSDDIRKCPPFCILILAYIAVISGVTRALSQGGKFS